MTIHWPFLLLAVVLLWVPFWLPAELRSRLGPRPRLARATLTGLLKTPLNWIDLIRAAAAVWLLRHVAIEVDPSVTGAGMRAFLLQAGVLTVGLLLQTIRVRPRIFFLAPVFYLCGVTLLLPDFWVGGFAVFVGWFFAVGGQKPFFLLPGMAVALGVGGLLLEGFSLRIPLAIGLLLLPLFLSFLFQHRLVFLSKPIEHRSDLNDQRSQFGEE
jgi:hypothetical protein